MTSKLPIQATPSLNDDFEIKNELKKLHIEPLLYICPDITKMHRNKCFHGKNYLYYKKCVCLLLFYGKSVL